LGRTKDFVLPMSPLKLGPFRLLQPVTLLRTLLDFVDKTLYSESGWSVSIWKVPPKLSLSLDNWFRRETGLNNLDPLLHGQSCCL